MGGVVDRAVNRAPKWLGGRATFFLGTLHGLRTYTNRPVRVVLDDGPPRETEVVNFAVANGRFFGGGMQIAPDAALDDGLFDVVGLERMTKRETMALSRTIYRGAHLGTRGVTVARARRVHAEPLDPRLVADAPPSGCARPEVDEGGRAGTSQSRGACPLPPHLHPRAARCAAFTLQGACDNITVVTSPVWEGARLPSTPPQTIVSLTTI